MLKFGGYSQGANCYPSEMDLKTNISRGDDIHSRFTPCISIMKEKNYTLELAGKTLTATFSDLAEQAGGSVLMKCEDTVVLATVCMSGDGKDNKGFFNLTVEYM